VLPPVLARMTAQGPHRPSTEPSGLHPDPPEAAHAGPAQRPKGCGVCRGSGPGLWQALEEAGQSCIVLAVAVAACGQYVTEELNVRALVPCVDPLRYSRLKAEPDFRCAPPAFPLAGQRGA